VTIQFLDAGDRGVVDEGNQYSAGNLIRKGAGGFAAVGGPFVSCYVAHMTQPKALDALMERAASWPEEAQAELVRFMIDTEAKHFGVYRLSDEEREAVRKGMEAAERGEFASDEEVAALFRRYRT
jgi:predicted transcriptional regulator